MIRYALGLLLPLFSTSIQITVILNASRNIVFQFAVVRMSLNDIVSSNSIVIIINSNTFSWCAANTLRFSMDGLLFIAINYFAILAVSELVRSEIWYRIEKTKRRIICHWSAGNIKSSRGSLRIKDRCPQRPTFFVLMLGYTPRFQIIIIAHALVG